LKSGHDARGDIGNLRVSKGGFTALQFDFDEQRIFSGWNIFAAKEIGGFDGRNFGNVERSDGASDVGKVRAVGKQQGEIALDRREARDGLEAACLTRSLVTLRYPGMQTGFSRPPVMRVSNRSTTH